MDEPIKVGDLVMAVRGHSCVLELMGGVPFTVRGIEPQIGGAWTCNRCGMRDLAPESAYGASGGPRPNVKLLKIGTGKAAIPLVWLKRIPPLDELQTYRQTDETTA